MTIAGKSAEGPETPAIVRIIDDQQPMREAIGDLLASVGLRSRPYRSARDFLRSDDMTETGSVVLDVRMPDMSGFDLLTEMASSSHSLPVVFVTGHGDIPMAVRAIKAGAIDFLAKPFDDQSLIDAVNAANRLDLKRRATAAAVTGAAQAMLSLSPGERDVLDLTVKGLRIKQIAAALGISEITVKVRRARMIEKLDVSSLPDLVRLHDLVNLTNKAPI